MKKRNSRRAFGILLGAMLAIGTAVAVPVGFAYGIKPATENQAIGTQSGSENTANWPVQGDEFAVINPNLNGDISAVKPATPPPEGNTPWSEPVVKDQSGTEIKPEQVKDLPTGAYVTANYTSETADGKDKTGYTIAIKITEKNTVPVNQTSSYLTRTSQQAASENLFNYPPSPYIPTGYYLQKGQEYKITLNMAPKANDYLQFGYGFYGIFDGTGVPYPNSVPLNNGADPQIKNFPAGAQGRVSDITTTMLTENEGVLYMIYRGNNKDNPYKIVKIEGNDVRTVPTYRNNGTDPVKSQEEFLNAVKTTESPLVEIVGKYVFATLRTSMIKDMYLNADTTKYPKRNTFEVASQQWDKTVSDIEKFYGLQRSNPAANNYVLDKYQNIVNPDHLSSPQQSGAVATNNRVTFQGQYRTAESSVLSAPGTGDYLIWHEINHMYQNPYFYFRSPSGAQNSYSFGEAAAQIATGYLGSINTPSNNVFEYSSNMTKLKNWIDSTDPKKNMFTPNLPFNEWQQAAVWYQLVQAFGDQYFAKLMQEYRNLLFDKTYANQNNIGYYITGIKDEPGMGISEQLMPVLASKVADRDLTPYFEKWGYPLSDKSKEEMKQYKTLETQNPGEEIWYNSTDPKKKATKIYDVKFNPVYLPTTAALTTKSENGVVSVDNAANPFEEKIQNAADFKVVGSTVETLKPDEKADKNKPETDPVWLQPHNSAAYVKAQDANGITIGYKTQVQIDYANTIRMIGLFASADDGWKGTRLLIRIDNSNPSALKMVFSPTYNNFYNSVGGTSPVVDMRLTDATEKNEKWSMKITFGEYTSQKFANDTTVIKEGLQEPYLNVAEGDIIAIVEYSPNRFNFSDLTVNKQIMSGKSGTTYKYKITSGKLMPFGDPIPPAPAP